LLRVYSVAPEEKVTTERVFHISQSRQEEKAGDRSAQPGSETTDSPQAVRVTGLDIAAGYNDVRAAGLCRVEEVRNEVRRVLKVGVHDADPLPCSLAHPLAYRASQPIGAKLRRPVNQRHGEP